MPRNGSGVYSLPAGSVFVPNTTIESSKVNGINADIASDLNTARPIVAGGTGATTVSGAQANLGIDPKISPVVKTANYTAVLADNNTYFRFTTAATLSLTAAATLGNGWKCYVHAYGVDVIIDPNSAETINGKATIGVKSGDWAMVICDGTSFYTRPISPASTPVVKTANYTALDVDNNKIFRFTSAATFAIDVTANLRDDWRAIVWNDSTGLIAVDPDSTNTINGATTIVLQNGQRAEIFKTSATTFQANILSDSFSGPQLQGYLTGLTISNSPGDLVNDIAFAAGAAAASSSPFTVIQLASAMTKQLDAAWVVGTNAGGLDTGAIANGTYHAYVMRRPDTGVVDACFSASASAPTTGGSIPSAYTQFRRVGSFLRVGGSIVAFIQDGDIFTLDTPVQDVSATAPGTSAVTRTLSVPVGIQVQAFGYTGMQTQTLSGAFVAYLSDLRQSDQTASDAVGQSVLRTPGTAGTYQSASYFQVGTNTSAQIRSRVNVSNANTVLLISTRGWIDTRGRV